MTTAEEYDLMSKNCVHENITKDTNEREKRIAEEKLKFIEYIVNNDKFEIKYGMPRTIHVLSKQSKGQLFDIQAQRDGRLFIKFYTFYGVSTLEYKIEIKNIKLNLAFEIQFILENTLDKRLEKILLNENPF